MLKQHRGKIIIGVIVILLFFFGRQAAALITDMWWFKAVNFSNVFTKVLFYKVAVWAVAFVVNGLVLWLNFYIAMRLTRRQQFVVLEDSGIALPEEKVLNPLVLIGVIIVSYFAAMAISPWWQSIALYLNAQEYGATDPVFQKDIGFYLFSLPFLEGLKNWAMALLIVSMILSLVIYGLKGAIQVVRGWRNLFTGPVKTHISLLLTGLALVWAFGYWLDRYELLFSSDGVVFGAGYTDLHARLFSYWAMIVVTLLIAVIFIVSLFRPGLFLTAGGIGLFIVAAVLMNGVYPSLQQKFVVEPNELEKEKPYIKNNIKLTRMAYELSKVQRIPYAADTSLSPADLNREESTVSNIRLWDWRPLLSTYRQIQEIRLYYRFNDVDIDRYMIKGKPRQVMLSARELDYAEVPEQARTWVNQRLKYTHGYGAVVSPVNSVTEEGMPDFFIKDIPPVSNIDLKIEVPQIYYGESTSHYVFTGTTTDEFDYPEGGKNKQNRYAGKGGVNLDSFLRRWLYAYHFGSFKLVISEYFTEKSKIHYHRQIKERVKKIAPFLRYDRDPYLVLIDGRMKWMIDAYTASDRFPYSEPVGRKTNYIRNPVKVLIDAYDGNVIFYLHDKSDPIIRAYAQMFPGLFETEIPEEVSKHFRYPADLFHLQSTIFQSYHMSDPVVFYNREDMWRTPEEIYEGKKDTMKPYYVIMNLPEREAEFLLIRPFTPVNKNNMVAWMAISSDGKDYGKKFLFEFPKKELIYGPMQIEARIDQHPEISRLLTLWSQKGSNVIRGNLLVIPVAGSLLYVEPLYLRAEQSQMPELKRVIVAYKNEIVMEPNLPRALNRILGYSGKGTDSSRIRVNQSTTSRNLVEQAARAFRNGQQALKKGDWQKYGSEQQKLGQLLEALLNRKE